VLWGGAVTRERRLGLPVDFFQGVLFKAFACKSMLFRCLTWLRLALIGLECGLVVFRVLSRVLFGAFKTLKSTFHLSKNLSITIFTSYHITIIS